ncbi:uncharacterized protein LOC120484550 [Pimephales promelas]|nr:uncharacterized protein LOC120484550 [Pimephales promelas]
MTMSGSNHTVPLDLTNKTRERGSCAQPGDQGRPKHTPERQVKPKQRFSTGLGILPPESRDSCDGSVSQTTQTDYGDVRASRTREGPTQTRPITPKCNSQTDAAGKPTDSSFSTRPIKKRPFPPDVDHDTSGPRNIPHSPGAKELKDSAVGQIHKDAPLRFSDSQFVTPYLIAGYPFFQLSRHYSQQECIAFPVPNLSPPPPLESTDRLLADIAAATCQDEDGDT